MNEKGGGWDLSDLEKEIDAAIEKTFVEKKSQKGPVAHPKGTYPASQDAGVADEGHPFPAKPVTKERTQPPSELQKKLDDVETQLLTLEWHISSKHINKAINLLQDLRRPPHGGDELEEVVVLIQKVLYKLLLDESKLSPIVVHFLQKSWKIVKRMTDHRFSGQIDKKTVVEELKGDFQRLRIEEEAAKEREKEVVTKRPPVVEESSFEEVKRLTDRIEELENLINKERKTVENIQQEIANYKAELARIFPPKEKLREQVPQEQVPQEEIVELDERLETGLDEPSDPHKDKPVGVSAMDVTLFEISGVVFGVPSDQILRSFPVKKWMADFFIKNGRVKLKDKEIPLLNLFQVFKLKPSTEQNPLVFLFKRRQGQPAAVIADRALSREEIEVQPIEGNPHVLGKGMSGRGEVWILNTKEASR